MIVYSFTKEADRQMSKLPIKIQRRIIKKIEAYLFAKDPFYQAERLVGVHGRVYRFRIGDYRVIFDRMIGSILITAVGHRREVYRMR